MIRPLAVVIAAIRLAAPTLPEQQARSYAELVHEEATRRSIDPLTIVAIVHGESKWHHSLIGGNARCTAIGLGQVCQQNYPTCRKDPEGAACASIRSMLLDGHSNLRVVAASITRWRKYCRVKTGRAAMLVNWLAAYGGYNNQARGVWCNRKKVRGRWVDLAAPRATAKTMAYRRWLISRL